MHVPSRPSSSLAWALLTLAASCTPLAEGLGPMPVRNQHPMQLTVLHLDPVPAAVQPAGAATVRLDTAYTSLWLAGSGGGSDLRLDGEILRAALDLRVGLGRGLELELELPVGYATGGGLDGFVTGWHDFWGLPDQGRSDFARDDYEVRASRAGVPVYQLEAHELQWMDVPIGVRAQVARAGPATLAARVAVELPTGDADAGFGNGEVDVAVGLLADARWRDVGLYAHVQHTFAGTPEQARRAGTEFRDVTAVGLGVDYRLFPGLSLLLQTQWETSTGRALGFERIADPHWLLWGGGRIALGETSWIELGIGEDLQPYISPDFTLWFAFGARFGGS